MRHLKVAVLWFLLASVSSAQSSNAATAADTARLPVTRVILYKNGVGYFEHAGRVRDSQDVNVDFTTSQLNDVLKSLTVLDLGKGRITGVSYNSNARSFWTRCVARASKCTADQKAPLDACSASTSARFSLKAIRRLRLIRFPSSATAEKSVCST